MNPGGTGGCFAAIQDAIDTGSSPLRIDVAAGTYAGFIVTRGTNVTIAGAGSGRTILEAGRVPVGVIVQGGVLALSGASIRNVQGGVVVGAGGRLSLEDLEIVSVPLSGVVAEDGSRLDAEGLRVTAGGAGVDVKSGSVARLGGARVTGCTTGISVQDASVAVNDSRVVRNATGVRALDSKLDVRRSRIAGNDVLGFELFGRSTKATISDSSVLNNGAGPSSVALSASAVGRLRIERSTVASNPGTGIVTSARSMAITTSTIAGNGVGLRVLQRIDRRGKLTVDNSTIAGNGTGIDCLQSESCGSFAGTIVADSTTSDCRGRITTRGYNLIEDASACDVTPLSSDLTGVDPKLGPLTDDGHLTDTKPLLAGSPAIDAVDGRFCRGTDQRGLRRGRPCDAGAYETAPAP